jgi:hypothetical protein
MRSTKGGEQQMSGASIRAVYTADDATAYGVRLPLWEYNVTNAAATLTQSGTPATTEPALPPGIRRRKRYYKVTASGKEGSFTVLDLVSNLWTSAAGTPLEIPGFNAAPPGANNATLEGRTGERMKHI